MVVSHKVVLVCQRLKHVPVNGDGFSAAAKPEFEKLLHKLGFWIDKKIGSFPIKLIHE